MSVPNPQAEKQRINRFSKYWRKFKEDSSFIRFYLWKYRRWVGFGLLTLVTVDILELFPPIYLKNAIDVVVEQRPKRYLATLALAYFATTLIQGFCRYGWRMFLIRSSMFAGRDLRQTFTEHLLGLSASFFDKRRIGDLMSLTTNDVDAVRMAVGPGLLTFADALFYLMTVPVAMMILSPKLTLLAFVPFPLLPWFVMRNETEIHARFQKVQESFSKLAAMAQENLNGIRVVKAFAREDVQLQRFKELGEEYIQLNMDLAKVQSAFGPTLDLTMSLGMVLLLFVGGKSVIGSAVTLGTFVAFQRYIQKMVWPMTAIGLSLSYYQRSIVSSQRMKEVLGISSDIVEATHPSLPVNYVPGGAWKTRGALEFRNLSFAFPGVDRLALKNIQLTVEPGERVAFVGVIGSGKSSLLSLLPRLYPVSDGMIFVDSIDINQWPIAELRNQIGYVGQELFLFSETVIENVAFGLAERSHDNLVHRALDQASVREDVRTLVNSFNTRLGERGVNVSGGQKQRLTIARALAKEPSILVLDDALSSVDVQTEEKILQGLRNRSGKNTELIGAHRISTVKDADRIIVLQNGSIFEQGTHEQLIANKSGIYHGFYEQQRLQEDFEEFFQSYDEKIPVPEGVL